MEAVLEEPKVTGRMVVLDESGDKSLVWDSDEPKQVKDAKEQFDKWKSKGYKMFKVTGAKRKQTPITKFDSSLEEILVIKTTKKG